MPEALLKELFYDTGFLKEASGVKKYIFIIGVSNVMFLNEKNPGDSDCVTINFDIIFCHEG